MHGDHTCGPVPGGGDRPESISITTIPDFHPAALISRTETGFFINLQNGKTTRLYFKILQDELLRTPHRRQ
jgi:hypothetical protein